MPRRALIVVAVLLAGSVVAGPGADAGAPALEATSVALDPATACTGSPYEVGDQPALDLGLVAGAPVEHLEAEVSDLGGRVTVARSEPAAVGPVDGVVEDVVVPIALPQAVVQVRVWMGAADPTPATAVEWSVFYGCEDGEVVVGASCFGPYDSCPATAVDTQRAIVVVDRGAPTVTPGGHIDTSISGCFAVDVGLFLALDGDVLDAEPGGDVSGGYSSEFGDPPLEARLDVPDDVPPGTVLDLWAYCGDDDPFAYLERWTATVVAPQPGDGAAPTPDRSATPAEPTPAAPTFTG